MYTSVAAFWSTPEDPDPDTGAPCWAPLEASIASFPDAGKRNIVVVGSDPSWYNAVNDDMRNAVRDLLMTGCAVLGYLSVREADPPYTPLDAAVVKAAYDGWMTNYVDLPSTTSGAPALSIDGVYFDEAVLPGWPDNDEAKKRVAEFHHDHPGAKVMILAGNTTDQWVVADPTAAVDPGPDYALMFEGTAAVYEGKYAASETTDFNMNVAIPAWWKDPANQNRFAHTVTATGVGDDWQCVLGLAVERNAGLLFAIDWNPNSDKRPNGKNRGYNGLPPYWEFACEWMQSYNTPSVGLSDELLLRAAHLWAQTQPLPGGGGNRIHGWPNGEQAWYPVGQMRGTYSFTEAFGGDLTSHTIPLPVNPPLYDVSTVWREAHAWAQGNGYLTALPTFVDAGAGQYEVVAIGSGVQWAKLETIPAASTYQQPTAAEVYGLVRNLHRAAQAAGNETAVPTFRADLVQGYLVTAGGGLAYEMVVFTKAAPIQWQDVPGTIYGSTAARSPQE